MAPAHRSASSFFAAFYRWSQHTHRPHKRTVTVQIPSTRCIRHFHATHHLHQHAHAQPRHDGLTSSQPVNEGTPNETSGGVVIAGSRLKHGVRSLMRKVPTSVAVITVAHYDHESKENVPMGVAVSSLSTVTLDPPTISFNIKHPSQTLDAIRAANGLFRVHFLASDEGGARIVELFCRGNHQDAYKTRQENTRIRVPLRRENGSPSESPMLTGESIRAAMECKLTQELTVADHVILVAEINTLDNIDPQKPSILYIDGSYMCPNGTVIAPPHTT